MSSLPSIIHRQNSNPYERQVLSVKRKQKSKKLRQSKGIKPNSNLVNLKPIEPRVEKTQDKVDAEESGFDAKYENISSLERMDLALDEYHDEVNRGNKTSINKLATTFGLDWKAIRQQIEFEKRDEAFFQHFSLDYAIDELKGLFPYDPMR